MFKSRFEAPEAEVARLAQSPAGSSNQAPSQIPVNIRDNVQDQLIELPYLHEDKPHTIVVVPIESHRVTPHDGEFPLKRYRSAWTCVVVASDHPSYPIGGFRVSIPEHQLVRGTVRTLATA